MHDKPLRNMRTRNDNALVEKGVTNLRQSPFINDGTRLWNLAPEEVTLCATLDMAKKKIKNLLNCYPSDYDTH